MKQAVILAGGKSTRLRAYLGALPKPLIDMGGIPLLERQILLLKKYNYDNVLILVDYNANAIVDYCKGKQNWHINIRCIEDGVPARGTAGAILQVLDLLQDDFLVLYGDVMLDMDLARFEQYHARYPMSAATLLLHPNDHPFDSDLVDVNPEQRVTNFFPYPHSPATYYRNLVNAAVYYVRKKALLYWQGREASLLDFGKHLFPQMLERGYELRGYHSPEYAKDCGTPERVDKVRQDLLTGKITRSNLQHQQRAVFIDRDGTVNPEVGYIRSTDQFSLFPNVAQAIKRLNDASYRVCLVTNQPVVARGECSELELQQIHNKMEMLLGREGAFLDKIYYCPHHPDRGFIGEVVALKKECNCRKPNTGMIDAAVDELNLSRQNSWMIGDSTMDILVARRAGIKSVLVDTGYGGRDQKYLCSPDFKARDLNEAVSFILETQVALV